MESREGINSDHILPGAFSVKYNIQVGPALWASCAENQPCFSFLSISSPSSVLQLGRNRVLPGNHKFLSFRHWLLVKPLEWNKIIISGDIFPMSWVFLCRILLPNSIIVQFFLPPISFLGSSFSLLRDRRWFIHWLAGRFARLYPPLATYYRGGGTNRYHLPYQIFACSIMHDGAQCFFPWTNK